MLFRFKQIIGKLQKKFNGRMPLRREGVKGLPFIDKRTFLGIFFPTAKVPTTIKLDGDAGQE